MFYSWHHSFIICSPAFHLTYTLLFKPKIWNFNLSVKRTHFKLSTVNCSCCFVHCSLFFLFWDRRSGFLVAILPPSLASIKRLFTVFTDIGCSRELFILFVVSGVVNSLFLLIVVAILLSLVAEVIH